MKLVLKECLNIKKILSCFIWISLRVVPYNVRFFLPSVFTIFKHKYLKFPWFDLLNCFENTSKNVVKRFTRGIPVIPKHFSRYLALK